MAAGLPLARRIREGGGPQEGVHHVPKEHVSAVVAAGAHANGEAARMVVAAPKQSATGARGVRRGCRNNSTIRLRGCAAAATTAVPTGRAAGKERPWQGRTCRHLPSAESGALCAHEH